MRSWWNLPTKLQHEDHMEESDSTVTLTGAEDECTKLSDSGGPKYGSIVHLSPSRIGNLSWWKKRKERIFRKKTLLMRVPILQWLPNYSTNDFVADLVAGITIGITVIPQALAYATIGGLPPEYGLYSAYMGCFVYVFLGSTRVVTIGPTALLGLLTHDGALLMGPEAAVLLAFLTGCISLLFGIFNFGFLIEFIAAPVIAGFTTAAALTIGTTQISSLLGLKFQAAGFVETWQAVFEHIQETQKWDAVMGFSSVAILLALRLLEKVRIGKDGDRTRIQCFINGAFWLISVSRNAIVIIVGCVIAATLIKSGHDAPFEITGNITGGLPSIQAPSFYIEQGNQTYNFVEICQNLGSALFVTPLIAILESMAIAKSFAKGQRIDASQEMIAIGTSNLLGSFVSSFPVSGSFSRTAVNNASGVRTAFGGIYTGALVLLAITVLTPYFFFIPKSCLAAVIITAVIFMVEVHLVKLVWKSRKLDLIPLFVTFSFCLFLSLEIGIIVGTAVNLAMLLYATARPRIKILTFQNTSGFENQTKYLYITPDRSVVFTAIDYFMSTVRKASALYPGVPVVIDLSYVSIADFSTAYGFDNLAEDLHKRGHSVVITRAHPRVLTILEGVRGSKLHVHRDGVELDVLLQDLWSTCAITGKNLKDIGNDTTQIPISSK
ncbi:sodium-independent sulfate anion transporter-like [Daphnia carinata]|uniref:sodium-independent sulfate anion transporter-like n=1 Tax=Daphnia carinata TaxID=120202 RepID=UPI00257E1B5F|nr:sodium-independent sulfate anion transporter-like [Daphnia carinata]